MSLKGPVKDFACDRFFQVLILNVFLETGTMRSVLLRTVILKVPQVTNPLQKQQQAMPPMTCEADFLLDLMISEK
jgi:hypothetical protein